MNSTQLVKLLNRGVFPDEINFGKIQREIDIDIKFQQYNLSSFSGTFEEYLDLVLNSEEFRIKDEEDRLQILQEKAEAQEDLIAVPPANNE